MNFSGFPQYNLKLKAIVCELSDDWPTQLSKPLTSSAYPNHLNFFKVCWSKISPTLGLKWLDLKMDVSKHAAYLTIYHLLNDVRLIQSPRSSLVRLICVCDLTVWSWGIGERHMGMLMMMQTIACSSWNYIFQPLL